MKLPFRILSLDRDQAPQDHDDLGRYLRSVHGRFRNAIHAETRVYTCRSWSPAIDEAPLYELRWNEKEVPGEALLGSFGWGVDNALIERISQELLAGRAARLFIYNSDADLCFQEALAPPLPPPSPPTARALEEARLVEHIQRTRHSEESILVYGDHLQRHDDPRGALIALEIAKREDPGGTLQAQALQMIPGWLQEETLLVWRYGHVVAATVHRPNALKALLRTPPARLLQRLKIARGLKSPKTIPRYLSLLEGSALLELDMSRCGVDSEDARVIASASCLGSLQALDLSSNRLGSEGACHLAKSTQLRALERLNLDSNDIDDGGAFALAATALLPLTRLSLQKNNISNAGARALLDNKRLRSLGISGPHIGKDLG